MMTAITPLALNNPSPLYLESLAAIERSKDRGQLAQGVTQLVQRAQATRDLARRNRYWFDAVYLLARQWNRDLSPGLLDPAAIRDAGRLLRVLQDQEDESVPITLKHLTQEVLKDSWESFDAFMNSPAPAGGYRVSFTEENWLGQYHEWLEKFLPCLMIGVPDNVADAEKELALRINWMVSKVTTRENDEFGYFDDLEHKCWAYVRTQYPPQGK